MVFRRKHSCDRFAFSHKQKFSGRSRAIHQILRPGMDLQARLLSFPLLRAAFSGDLDQLRELLSKSRKYIDYFDPADGLTAAHAAVVGGHHECLSILILFGANTQLNTFFDHAYSLRKAGALHIACQEGHLKCISVLAENGVDMNKTINDNQTSPIDICCRSGNVECLCLCLEHGADINLVMTGGQTALFTACIYGQAKCLLLLLNREAHFRIVDDSNLSPIDYARMCGHPECVGILLHYGSFMKGEILHIPNELKVGCCYAFN